MKIEVNLSKDDIKELKELNEKLASMKSLLAEDVLGKILYQLTNRPVLNLLKNQYVIA